MADSTREPRVALIVPALEGGAPGLEADAAKQTRVPDQVIIVRGVRPNGRARNEGVRQCDADIFVFIDDDARMGNAELIAQLIAPLSDASIGVTGSAKLLPPDAPEFQRAVARQVPRIEHAIVTAPLESNPPTEGHGYSTITTTCAAMRRDVFEKTGGFSESLYRGVDTEFFSRVRRLGYRFVQVPHAYVTHPAPATFQKLWRKHLKYGVGFSQEVRRDASKAGWRYLHTPLHAAGYLFLRTVLVIPHTFIAYSGDDKRARLAFRPLGALASYAAAIGYVCGWYGWAPKE
jgi:GT2 family glycosyltransferase